MLLLSTFLSKHCPTHLIQEVHPNVLQEACPGCSTCPVFEELPHVPCSCCLRVYAACSVPVWLLVGLGARGLVYHAWLGKLTAAAVLSNSEEGLPPELLEWRKQPASTQAPLQAEV